MRQQRESLRSAAGQLGLRLAPAAIRHYADLASGQLAGAIWGERGIPEDWRAKLAWRDRIRAWKHLSGGCHLNRAIGELIENAGFRIERLDKGYMQGPRPMTFMYEGSARPR
jgi:hypothetical protein